MVICGIVLSPKIFGELRAERVRDSKRIGPKRRKELARFLKKKVKEYEIVEFGPAEIDQLRGKSININQIEAMGFVRVLKRLNPPKAYIDSAAADADEFARNVRDMIEEDVELVVEHGADEKYIPVSAASIIAKVRRDERIEKLKEEYGETGSGYPSDGRTVQFLKEWMRDHENLPDFARKSWKTAQRIKSESEK